MSTAYLKADRPLLTSFTSTLGVGSSWVSSVFDVTQYKGITGYCKASSSNLVLNFQHSGVAGTMHVSSTQAVAAATGTISFSSIAQYLTVGVSTVNSSVDVLGIYIYGSPL